MHPSCLQGFAALARLYLSAAVSSLELSLPHFCCNAKNRGAHLPALTKPLGQV